MAHAYFLLSYNWSDALQTPDRFMGVGPIFHRWLPNGRADQVELQAPSARIFVWFERCGFVRDGWIIYDTQSRSVDPEVLDMQGGVHAGPLFVEVELEVPAPNAVDLDLTPSSPLLRQLAKVIQDPLDGFINLLRFAYAQHWLSPFRRWDSREESVSSYIARLEPRYRLCAEDQWQELVLEYELPPIAVYAPLGSPESHLNERDWHSIRQAPSIVHLPPMEDLERALQHLEQRNLRYALIDGVTALESALGEALRREPELLRLLPRVKSESDLAGRLAATAALMGGFPPDELRMTIRSIRARNDLMHPEKRGSPPSGRDVMALLRVVAKLLGLSNWEPRSSVARYQRRSASGWSKKPHR